MFPGNSMGCYVSSLPPYINLFVWGRIKLVWVQIDANWNQSEYVYNSFLCPT